MRFESQLEISTDGPPIVVDSYQRCVGLNADMVDGLHATSFAPSSHTHDAGSIVTGVMANERLAGGTIAQGKGLLIRSGVKT